MKFPQWRGCWRELGNHPLFQLALLIWCLTIFAIYFGLAGPLAAWWFGTPAPTRAQVEAFGLTAILIMAWPVIGFFAWSYWHQREEEEDSAARDRKTNKRSNRRGKS